MGKEGKVDKLGPRERVVLHLSDNAALLLCKTWKAAGSVDVEGGGPFREKEAISLFFTIFIMGL